MKNYVQEGRTLTLAAPAAISAGDVVKVGAFIGVASCDAESGADVETVMMGVFELPKAAESISQGDALYWDASNSNVTATSAGNTAIGTATVAAASGDVTVNVRLIG